MEDGGAAYDSLPASSLGNSWSVGDYNCCTIYPSSYLFMELIYLEPTSHQTLDQPWDLTLFDGATEDYGKGII